VRQQIYSYFSGYGNKGFFIFINGRFSVLQVSFGSNGLFFCCSVGKLLCFWNKSYMQARAVLYVKFKGTDNKPCCSRTKLICSVGFVGLSCCSLDYV